MNYFVAVVTISMQQPSNIIEKSLKFVEELGDILVSTIYIDIHTDLEIQCENCKEVFKKSYKYYKLKRRCAKCFGPKPQPVIKKKVIVNVI